MKRRTLLRSLFAVPSVAALPAEALAQPAQAPSQEVKPPSPETPKTATNEADAASDPVIKTFSPAQFAALRKLGEIVMPASQGVPGAVEAGAAEFLDFLIGVSPPDRVTLYKSGLDRLNTEAHQHYNKPFGEITPEQAELILAPLHAAWSYRGPGDTFTKFLLAAKSDLLTATANSHEYIAVVSQRRRSGGGVGQYWYPIE